MIERFMTSLDKVRLRVLMICLPIVLAGCAATEIGQRQIYTPPPNSGVTTRPDNGLAPLTPLSIPQVLQQTGPTSSHPAMIYPRSIEDTQSSTAVLALYKQFQQERNTGKLDAAGDALQRALRLDPRNAFLWNALASLHLQQQQPDQVEGEASKSNSLAGGNPYLEAANWRLIAAARQAQGNAAGALQAQTQAEQAMQGQSPGQ